MSPTYTWGCEDEPIARSDYKALTQYFLWSAINQRDTRGECSKRKQQKDSLNPLAQGFTSLPSALPLRKETHIAAECIEGERLRPVVDAQFLHVGVREGLLVVILVGVIGPDGDLVVVEAKATPSADALVLT